MVVSIRLVPKSCLCSGQQESRGIAPKELEMSRAESIISVCTPSNTFSSISVNSLIELIVLRCQCRSLLSEKQNAPNCS